jgi:hypothetical protein
MEEPKSFSRPKIPRSISQTFRAALSLPDTKLRAINLWAKKHLMSVLESGPEDQANIHAECEKLGVSPADFGRVVTFLATALLNEQTPGSIQNIDNYIDWLKENEIGEVAAKARILLDGLSIPPVDAVYLPQKKIALASTLPTLEDVDVVCDLRAVFRRFPSASQSSEHQENVKTLLGFEPVVILALHLNDAAGNDTSRTFQLTENGLQSLIKTLSEALTQLATLKQQKEIISGRTRNA